MKKFAGATISLTAIVLFLMSSINASAAPRGYWVRVITRKLSTNGNQGIYLVDKSSIETSGNVRSYWVGLIYGKPVSINNKGKKASVSKVVAYTSVNCKNRNSYSFYKIGAFDPKDKLITVMDFKNGIVSLPPQGTKATGNYVCSRK